MEYVFVWRVMILNYALNVKCTIADFVTYLIFVLNVWLTNYIIQNVNWLNGQII